MFWCRRAAFALTGAVALMLAGCQGTQATAAADPQAVASQSAPAVAGSTDGEHVATPRYTIDIAYPVLGNDEAPLAAMLHRIANAAKREFLRALPDPGTFPEFADRQLQLRVDFKLAARTSAFTSVRESGFQDTGGAHPAPIDAAIVYDTHAQRAIPLDDLFAQPDDALKALADFARAALTERMLAQAPKAGEAPPQAIAAWKANAKQMVVQGTEPTQQNFANFVVRAGARPDAPSPGLTLIFPPYQVAAYVYGTQAVQVPARVFAAYLKPQYGNAFVIN